MGKKRGSVTRGGTIGGKPERHPTGKKTRREALVEGLKVEGGSERERGDEANSQSQKRKLGTLKRLLSDGSEKKKSGRNQSQKPFPANRRRPRGK